MNAKTPLHERQWSKTKRAWAIGVPTVTVLAVGITALSALGDRSTSANTLSARNSKGAVAVAQPPEAEYRVIGELDDPSAQYEANSDNFRIWWDVPVDALIETFPEGPRNDGGFYGGCSDAQFEWLEEHAVDVRSTWTGTFAITLQNNATEGGVMSLSNLRFDGGEVPSAPHVRFACPIGGMGASGAQYILLDADGGQAVWSAPIEGRLGQDHPEGSAATVTIEPGGATPLSVVWADGVNDQKSYEGRLLADVEGDTSETVVLAESVVSRRAPVLGYFLGYGVDGYADGLFRCGTPATGPRFEGDDYWESTYVTEVCEPEDAVEILRLARAEAGR